ncbi:hypothetical protein CQW23_25024 [Capsicum baccatum]|uniref:Uncharacterized protein n=1 Tax=Capsicum baccatum TaxID=33114 RepID=A0A2G2VWH2_CAPBA|nr:hypothetical protein CQW23_25024 [Capsicum baccatum]
MWKSGNTFSGMGDSDDGIVWFEYWQLEPNIFHEGSNEEILANENWKLPCSIQSLRISKLKMLSSQLVSHTRQVDSLVHPNHDKFVNQKIDMFNEMSLVCGNDRARGDCAKSFEDIDFECFSEKNNDNDIEGPSTKKDVQVAEASQGKASCNRKRSFEVQDVIDDIN